MGPGAPIGPGGPVAPYKKNTVEFCCLACLVVIRWQGGLKAF